MGVILYQRNTILKVYGTKGKQWLPGVITEVGPLWFTLFTFVGTPG